RLSSPDAGPGPAQGVGGGRVTRCPVRAVFLLDSRLRGNDAIFLFRGTDFKSVPIIPGVVASGRLLG
ncbi:MAG: hypothetical protein OXS28_00570, partial [Gammaproteobacteria bacterium]|nr:hypothetical protein [Gammaproteobacteria bacterium]